MVRVLNTSTVREIKVKDARDVTLIVRYQGRYGITTSKGVALFDGGFISTDSTLGDATVEVMQKNFRVTIEQYDV